MIKIITRKHSASTIKDIRTFLMPLVSTELEQIWLLGFENNIISVTNWVF